MRPKLTTIRKFKDSLASMDLSILPLIDSEDFAILKLEELGIRIPYQAPTYRPNHFSIIVVFDGSANYLVGDNNYELRPNQILFARPNAFLSCKWNQIGRVYNISFSEHFLLKYWPTAINKFQHSDDSNGYAIHLPHGAIDDFKSICDEMYSEYASDALYKYDLIANLLLNLLMLVYRQNHLNGSLLPEQKSNPYATTFLRELENNFSRITARETTTMLRIKDYAKLQNLNENYLSKVVSTATGKTVNQWIHEKLINEIRYLLKYTNTPMREIATIYGFDDLNYFYSYFKRHTQNAPGSLRKNFSKIGSYATMESN